MCQAKFSDWSAAITKKQRSTPLRVAEAASCLGPKPPPLCVCLGDSLYFCVPVPHFKMGGRKEAVNVGKALEEYLAHSKLWEGPLKLNIGIA